MNWTVTTLILVSDVCAFYGGWQVHKLRQLLAARRAA